MSAQAHEQDENEIISIRRQKLAALRDNGFIYPNTFRRDHLAGDLASQFGDNSAEDLQTQNKRVAVAGRMMLRRIMGKASFTHIQDMSGQIQLYLRKDNLADNGINPNLLLSHNIPCHLLRQTEDKNFLYLLPIPT